MRANETLFNEITSEEAAIVSGGVDVEGVLLSLSLPNLNLEVGGDKRHLVAVPLSGVVPNYEDVLKSLKVPF